jgi:hypothetical protein
MLKKEEREWKVHIGFEEVSPEYKFGPVVGGIANKTAEIRTLKTKQMSDETSTGQVCENASLKESILPRLNEVLGDTFPSITRDKACCILELMLRLLEKRKHEGKTWFLNAVSVIDMHHKPHSILKLLKARGKK